MAALDVVVVDDHAVVRSGVRALLERQPAFRVVAEAGDVPGAVEAVRLHRPALVVLDVQMPGEPSLPAITRIRELSPETHVVVLTMHDEPEFAARALAAGAAGYVLKEAAPGELVRALRAVASGERYLHPSVGARLASAHDGHERLRHLTARERDVLLRIVHGARNRDIAEELHLSVRTIETHRARLQEKLGVSGLLELVEFARRNGLLDD